MNYKDSENEGFEKELNRHQLYRLRKKAENFIIIDEALYLKIKDGLHEKVLLDTQTNVMKLEIKKLHEKNHFGQNRM